MKNVPVIINSDPILDKKNFTDTDCGWKAAYLDIKHDYEPSWGSIFAYSKQYRSWMQLFDFHFWSFDGDNLVDSFSGISSQCGGIMKVKKPSKYTYKLLHHSDFDFKKVSVEMWKGLIMGNNNPIQKELNRCYSPDKYDFIYIEGIFHNPKKSDGWLYDEECEKFYEEYHTGISVNENIRITFLDKVTKEVAGYASGVTPEIYLPNGKIVKNIEELEGLRNNIQMK